MDGHGGDYTINPRGNAFLAWLLKKGQLRTFAREFFAHRRTTGHPYWKITRDEIFAPLLPHRVLDLASRLRHGSAPPWSEMPIANAFAARLHANGHLDDSRHYMPSSPREYVRLALRTISDNASTSLSNETAARQMELTRPFHDRRVVEFGLAVPEDLYVRDGWNRYLARTAMRDLYPPEFAARWRRNDDPAPDFHRRVKELESIVNLQLDRMAADELVPRYVDIQRVRELLASREINDHNSGWEQETQLAVSGLLAARFVEWFKDQIEHSTE
jgi:asparagine synthase (glutamine-hydrolysing)